MEKYLFTDGTNVKREVETKEELQTLIQAAADSAKVRIWLFNTSEWISLADFNKLSSKYISPGKKIIPVAEIKETAAPLRKSAIPGLLKKTSIGIVAAAAIFLVYNFTRVTWSKAIATEYNGRTPCQYTAGKR
jgi:hypothetical protein